MHCLFFKESEQSHLDEDRLSILSILRFIIDNAFNKLSGFVIVLVTVIPLTSRKPTWNTYEKEWELDHQQILFQNKFLHIPESLGCGFVYQPIGCFPLWWSSLFHSIQRVSLWYYEQRQHYIEDGPSLEKGRFCVC